MLCYSYVKNEQTSLCRKPKVQAGYVGTEWGNVGQGKARVD